METAKIVFPTHALPKLTIVILAVLFPIPGIL